MPRYWVIAPYFAELPEEYDRVWAFDLRRNVISIGFSRLGDPSRLSQAVLRRKVNRLYSDHPSGNRTSFFHIMWRFYNEVALGDVIIARRGRKAIAAIGTVTRRALHDPRRLAGLDIQYHFSNHVGVRWSDYPRDKSFAKMVFGIQTLYEITPEKYAELVGALPPFPQSMRHLPDPDELVFPEGREVYRLHRERERNKKLIEAAKRARLVKDPSLKCDACGFSFKDKYGRLGKGFIEGHHTLPLSQKPSRAPSRVKDIALVCSNCHRMLHRRRPWLRMRDLQSLIAQR